MPRINLLPWREQQRTERKKAFGVGMVAATVGRRWPWPARAC